MPGDAIINPKTVAVLGIAEPLAGAKAIANVRALNVLADALGVPFLDLASIFDGGPFLIGDGLSGGIADLQKRSLILGGAALDGAILQTAITSLLDGYDVFIPADLCVALEPGRSNLVFDRIRDVGGIITTERQILLECLAQFEEPRERDPLQARLDQLVLQFDRDM